jgi:hypothetical protein
MQRDQAHLYNALGMFEQYHIILALPDFAVIVHQKLGFAAAACATIWPCDTCMR